MLALACGYNKVSMVAQAQEALAQVRTGAQPDLVFINLGAVPENLDLGEFEPVKVLRQMRGMLGKGTAFVMLSSHDRKDVIERCIAEGADAYVFKPIQKEELRAMDAFVARRRKAAETKVATLTDCIRAVELELATLRQGEQKALSLLSTSNLSSPKSSVELLAVDEAPNLRGRQGATSPSTPSTPSGRELKRVRFPSDSKLTDKPMQEVIQRFVRELLSLGAQVEPMASAVLASVSPPERDLGNDLPEEASLDRSAQLSIPGTCEQCSGDEGRDDRSVEWSMCRLCECCVPANEMENHVQVCAARVRAYKSDMVRPLRTNRRVPAVRPALPPNCPSTLPPCCPAAIASVATSGRRERRAAEKSPPWCSLLAGIQQRGGRDRHDSGEGGALFFSGRDRQNSAGADRHRCAPTPHRPVGKIGRQ